MINFYVFSCGQRDDASSSLHRSTRDTGTVSRLYAFARVPSRCPSVPLHSCSTGTCRASRPCGCVRGQQHWASAWMCKGRTCSHAELLASALPSSVCSEPEKPHPFAVTKIKPSLSVSFQMISKVMVLPCSIGAEVALIGLLSCVPPFMTDQSLSSLRGIWAEAALEAPLSSVQCAVFLQFSVRPSRVRAQTALVSLCF